MLRRCATAWLFLRMVVAVQVVRHKHPNWAAKRLRRSIARVLRAAEHHFAQRQSLPSRNTAALFEDCDSAYNNKGKPVAAIVANHLVTQKKNYVDLEQGVKVEDLKCVGAGGFGITYSGKYDGKAAAVKFHFLEKKENSFIACKWAALIQKRVNEYPGATGAGHFVKAYKWGVWELGERNIPYEIWERVDGVDLQVLMGQPEWYANEAKEKNPKCVDCVFPKFVRYLPGILIESKKETNVEKFGGRNISRTKSFFQVKENAPLEERPYLRYRKFPEETYKDTLQGKMDETKFTGIKPGGRVPDAYEPKMDINKNYLKVTLTGTTKAYFFKARGFSYYQQTTKKMDEVQALSCVKGMVEAVIFLWEAGLQHNDFQRSNIMWSTEVKVIDYDTMAYIDHTKQIEKNGNKEVYAAVTNLFLDRDWSSIPIGEKLKKALAMFIENEDNYMKNLDAFKQFYRDAFGGKISEKKIPAMSEDAVKTALSE